MLGNCCFVATIQGTVVVEATEHWALFFAGLFECWLQDMLSSAAAEGT
jgi:hypothetical protein